MSAVGHPDEASTASGIKNLGQQRAVPVILTTGAQATGGTDLDSFAYAKPVPVSENRAALLAQGL